MIDRLLNATLRLTIIGFIMLMAGVTLIIAYRGLLDLCTLHYCLSVTWLGLSTLLGTASLILCRYGNDLMDR